MDVQKQLPRSTQTPIRQTPIRFTWSLFATYRGRIVRLALGPTLALVGLSLLLWPACSDDDSASSPDAQVTDGAVPDAAALDGAEPDGASPDAAAVDGAAPDSGIFVCDPPAAAGSLFELEADFKDAPNPVSLCQYRGQVILIVNVAALCGYTHQFGGLAQLQTTYESQGFTVLGFYSDQFMNQAGSPQQQQDAETQYGVNFPCSEIINVNPPNEHPIYTWLKNQPGGSGEIGWNFVKFLISRDGELLGRWDTSTEPSDSAITDAIEAAL
jgi:glutathione peroxidase